METIVANVQGKTRKATLNGRSYVVAPATLIVPGILEGSQGPLLYEAADVEKSVSAWNGMPVVGYHPTLNGSPVSARHPEVMEKYNLGTVFNAAFAEKLTADMWFDESLTRAFDQTLAVANRILPRLEAGQPVELSTGLDLDQEPAPAGSVRNGKPYRATARNFKPDHVAALPDKIGACGIADGCGVLNHAADEKKSLWQKLGQLLGIAKSEETATVSTNQTVSAPETAVTKESEAAMNKAQTIDWLVANCSCWGASDKETLNKLPDDKLAALKAAAEKAKASETALNESRKPIVVGGVEYVWNETAMKHEPKSQPVSQTAKPVTAAEWLATAPPEIQGAVRNSMAIEQREKTALVARLTANVTDAAAKQAHQTRLMQKPVEELTDLVALLPPVPGVSDRPAPSYFGAAVPPSGRQEDPTANELLEVPTINWAEVAIERAKR